MIPCMCPYRALCRCACRGNTPCTMCYSCYSILSYGQMSTHDCGMCALTEHHTANTQAEYHDITLSDTAATAVTAAGRVHDCVHVPVRSTAQHACRRNGMPNMMYAVTPSHPTGRCVQHNGMMYSVWSTNNTTCRRNAMRRVLYTATPSFSAGDGVRITRGVCPDGALHS